jgi:hypothetical protein
MKPRVLSLFKLWLSPLLLGAACQPISLLPENFSSCEPAPFTLPNRPITYYEDIKPILDGRCVECHTPGGIGPFTLDTFEQAFKRNDLLPSAVQEKTMPPWPADDCCASYERKRSLTSEQIALITAWVNLGALEGDPLLEGSPLEPSTVDLPRIDATIEMPEPYEPQVAGGSDELRCFLLDWPFTDEKFITGFTVRPGNRTAVHHVALLTLNQEDALEAERSDAADERLGFDCDTFSLEPHPSNSIGTWSPGYRSVIYPDNIGLRAPANSMVLMQVHYDVSHSDGSLDQTAVDFMIEDEIEHEAKSIPVGNPLWQVKNAMLLKAGEEDVMYNFAYDPTKLLNANKGFRIFGVNLHMHEFGTQGSLAILRKNGSADCLFHTTLWDFDWIGEYTLTNPIEFLPGDELYIECHWNTQGLSEELQWGVDEEMCGGLLSVIELE